MTRAQSTRWRVTPGRRALYEAARARWLRPVPEALRRSGDHLSATHALLAVGDGGLAQGAALVALRSAAAASAGHAEFVAKWDALGDFARVVPTTTRGRFARLCEAARRVEVERRIAGSLSVEPSGLVPDPSSPRAARRVDPAAADLYVDVLWMDGHLGRVLGLLADVAADAGELEGRGLASAREGVDSYLCDVALGLCLRPPSTAPEVADHAVLLVAIEPAARSRPAVWAMIELALDIDGTTRGQEAPGGPDPVPDA